MAANINMVSSIMVPEVLRKDNYANWSVCVQSYLLAQDLSDIIEATTEPPRPDEVGYKQWRRRNAMALHAIQISCGPDVLSQIRKYDQARKAWNELATLYGSMSSTNFDIEQGMSNDRNLRDYVENGNWEGAFKVIMTYPQITTATSSSGKTVLHYAVIAGHAHIVKNLVVHMPIKGLGIQDHDGNTALALAATFTGITEMARYMVKRDPNLVGTRHLRCPIPVILASAKGHKEMTRYLYAKTPPELLGGDDACTGALLLCHCISSEIFDVALKLLVRDPDLPIGFESVGSPRPLYALAQVPSAFPSGSRPLFFWQKWIYSKEDLSVVSQLRGLVSTALRGRLPGILSKSKVLELIGIKQICDQPSTHNQAIKILDCLYQKVRVLNVVQQQRASAHEAMLEAAKHGIVEFITKMSDANQDLLFVLDGDSRGIFSYAILHRRDKIFNLIYGLKRRRQVIISVKDKFDNNLLHLVGMPQPSSELRRRSGAALQMQRELQWFQAVENIVHPRCKEEINIDGLKPHELFTQNHQNLIREGEKWAKETATSFTVVGTLITTIMFAAAFTVPGGNDQITGIPIFLHTKMFKVFIVSDALSLFASSTSVLMFLGILTSRYAEEDFLVALPTKLIVGLCTLFFSIVTMMITFCAALVLMLRGKLQFVILAISLASFPVIIFVPLQYPLLLQICRSTFRSGILSNMKMKNW